jgi:sarcosine oxidase subunit alpha
MLKADRKQLVGLLTADPKTVLEEGAQIVLDPNQPLPMKMVGHVTSSYWSETLGRSIALAVIEGGNARMGTTVHIPMTSGTLTAQVTSTVFFDPDNTRLSA